MMTKENFPSGIIAHVQEGGGMTEDIVEDWIKFIQFW
jgi:hypothetical protein